MKINSIEYLLFSLFWNPGFWQTSLPQAPEKLKCLLVVRRYSREKHNFSCLLFLCDSKLFVVCYLLSLTNFLLPLSCCYLNTTRLPSLVCHPPTTTSHCLPLPTCNYLPHPASCALSACKMLPPANTCQCFNLPGSDTAATCRYMPLPAIIPRPIRSDCIGWNYTTDQDAKQP